MSSPLGIKIIAILILLFGVVESFAQCRNIDADAKVIPDNRNGNTIIIEFKNVRKDLFKINLFGPDRKNILDSERTEFTNLTTGKYIVVIVGKREEDQYCAKSITVTIN